MIPGPGPAWFGSVMGTGILATLLQIHAVHLPGAGAAALVVLALAWLLLLGLGAGFVRSVLADPAEWDRTAGDPAMLPLWGTVSMGMLAVGSATGTVVPTHAPSATGVAVGVDAALWTVGTVLGLGTALGFTAWILRRRPAHPLPTWALPMVPPMVSATVGLGLVPHVPSAGGRTTLWAVCAACFVLALVLGGVVIVVAYHHALRRTPLPLELSISTWIPLGIAGQSTASAQLLPLRAREFLSGSAGDALAAAGRGYGIAALVVGALLAGVALTVTVRGFLRRMPFSPGWWSLTFPVGTCSLGAHYLGWEEVSVAALAVLCGTWTLCAVASGRAVLLARAGSR